MRKQHTEGTAPLVAAEAVRLFREQLGREKGVTVAPGRANLVGEHTDYNEGFVLPIAIDRYVAAVFSPRSDGCLVAYSTQFSETRRIRLHDLEHVEGGWSRYVAAMAWVLRSAGIHFSGANILIHSELPVGAGLSSSAALELAAMNSFLVLAGAELTPKEMAELARRGENEFVNVPCGIMDQLTVACASDSAALLIDCRSLAYSEVRVPQDAVVFVLDTGVRRALAGSVYATRVKECRDALGAINQVNGNARSLRDVTPALLEKSRHALPEVLYRRARHVIDETRRPAVLAAAFEADDLPAAGRVMNASHESLRDLYDVSSMELDLVVDLARTHPACFGARLTGAGLGGCAVALVDRGREGEFSEWMSAEYSRKHLVEGEFYSCRPAAGAHVLKGW